MFKTLRQSWPKTCRKRVVRRLHATKSYRVNRPYTCVSDKMELIVEENISAMFHEFWNSSFIRVRNFCQKCSAKKICIKATAKIPLQSVMATFYNPKDHSFFIFATCNILLFCFICFAWKKKKAIHKETIRKAARSERGRHTVNAFTEHAQVTRTHSSVRAKRVSNVLVVRMSLSCTVYGYPTLL